MNTLNVKTGDTVVVLSGKDKGKQGKVLSVAPKKGTVVVEGIAITAPSLAVRARPVVSLTARPPSMPARLCVSAPSVARPPAPHTRLLMARS